MKITTKLIAVATIALAAAHLLSGALCTSSSERLSAAERAAMADAAATLARAVDVVWEEGGAAAALEMVERLDDPEGGYDLALYDADARATMSVEAFAALAEAEAEAAILEPEGEQGALALRLGVGPGDSVRKVLAVRRATLSPGGWMSGDAGRFGLLLALCNLALLGAGLRWIDGPLRSLGAQLSASARDGGRARISVRGGDEIGRLAERANEFLDGLRQSWTDMRGEWQMRTLLFERLRRADRLSTMARLASVIAHDLGTPLNVVSGRAMMISSTPDCAPEIVSDARIIGEQANNMTRLIRKTLDYARRGELHPADEDMGELIESAISLVTPIAEHSQVSIEFLEAPAIMAKVDEQKVLQILTNVMINGVQALPEGGRMRVRLDRELVEEPPDARAAAGQYVRITIEDEGVGMAPELRENVFEPFFQASGGTPSSGLGLAVCYAVVREHGGWITVHSELGEGSRFDVYLPNSNDEGEDA
ncbi:sensor histidine kinase [Haliangium ochraceum]|uniref:histidine kinase n=1 Tax=Haliangium ochraceum (strain DSM 14365 / JCM 11303 / SMP-2) TaxID=502025 RepID=D0LHZ3_HALO1|nr:HAMP domain-containing sensor histidine kinase [Haliangium ochraceum]ACY14822.1 integral membrane sensor signal transduction histidine kinase [Haliangium ochraceum DSM 14365]